MMQLILRLWNIAKELARTPGALEALVGVAEAAKAKDAALVRARAEALAMLTAYKASYRV